jgi:hypothetical protein
MKTLLAVAGAAFLFAAPAFAAEEYQFSPALTLADQVPSQDTGSAQMPHFDGQSTVATPREQIIARNANEASVESANSLPVAILARR